MSLEQSLQQMAQKWISSQFMSLLNQGMGALGNLLGGAFGGGGGSGLSWNNSSTDFLLGKASGGPVSGSTPYLVGENGPELFVPQGAGGNIVPNGQLGGMMGRGAINIYQNIQTPDAQSFRRSEGQISAQTAQTMAYHQRRNGY